jgi:asparagine synthase (glutamine-hydrolysing)
LIFAADFQELTMNFQAGLLYMDERKATSSDLTAILAHSPCMPFETTGEVVDHQVAMVYRGRPVTREDLNDVQPFSDGTYIIAWDGRLDNRQAIAAGAGLIAGDMPDAELVLRAFANLGESLFAVLVGEFAVVLWSATERKLFLARSACGSRPLFYTSRNDVVLWSSNFSHLVRYSSPSLALDDGYILEYLLSQPAPGLTPFAALRAVPAGSFVVCGPWLKCQTHSFWSSDNVTELRYPHDHDYEEHCRSLLSEAVSVRLSRSLHKVFFELSGGLDSSSLVLLGDELLKADQCPTAGLRTLSCVYEESITCDESFFIAEVERFRGESGEHITESEQTTTLALQNILFTGLPSPHHCFPGRYPAFVQRMKAAGARLLLTGTGGDHIFWSGADGVPVVADAIFVGRMTAAHSAALLWSRVAGIPSAQLMLQAMGMAVGSGHYYAPPCPVWLAERHARRARSLVWDYSLRPHSRELPSRCVHRHLIASLFATTSAGYFDDYSDIFVSHPYTHRPLVEFCLALPVSQLQRNGQSRSLMRRSLADLLPPRILKRQTKGALDECFSRALEREWDKIGDVREWQICQRGYAQAGKLLESLQKARLGIRLEDQSLIRVCSLEGWLRSLESIIGSQLQSQANGFQAGSCQKAS